MVIVVCLMQSSMYMCFVKPFSVAIIKHARKLKPVYYTYLCSVMCASGAHLSWFDYSFFLIQTCIYIYIFICIYSQSTQSHAHSHSRSVQNIITQLPFNASMYMIIEYLNYNFYSISYILYVRIIISDYVMSALFNYLGTSTVHVHVCVYI